MSFIFETPQLPLARGVGGYGEAGLGVIWRASRDQMILVDNTFARKAAREEAYDRRIAAIAEATGETLQNPLRQTYTRGERKRGRPSPAERWTIKLAELAARHPDATDAIRADIPIEEDARAITREAEERAAVMAGSREGPLKWAAMIGGGMAGALRDPVQVAALAAGAGPGAARTVAGRILTVAAREAAINASVELAVQPAVQSWRKEAGLTHGAMDALRKVMFAAGFGGAFGVAGQGAGEAGQGAGEAGRALLRSRRMTDALAEIEPQLTEVGRNALSTDADAAARGLAPIRDTLAADARGAIAQMEIERVVTAARRTQGAPPIDDATERAALRLAQDRSLPPEEPAPVLIDAAEAAPARAPEPLSREAADERLAAIDFDAARLEPTEVTSVITAASSDAEAMVLSRQRRNALQRERDELAAVQPTGDTAPDGTPLLETRAPSGAYVGRAPAEADADNLPLAFSEGERPARLAALDDRIADMDRQLDDGPLAEDVALVEDARAFRGRLADGSTDLAGGVDDPALPREDLLTDAQALEALGDIALPGDDGPIDAAALARTLQRTEDLTRVVEACRV